MQKNWFQEGYITHTVSTVVENNNIQLFTSSYFVQMWRAFTTDTDVYIELSGQYK